MHLGVAAVAQPVPLSPGQPAALLPAAEPGARPVVIAPVLKPVPVPVSDQSALPIKDPPARYRTPAVGRLVPDTGPWHTFVQVTGPNFAGCSGVSVVWYPGNDSNQKSLGTLSVTVRKRMPPDRIEIEIPQYSGAEGGGPIRVMVSLPNQLAPVLAGEFVIGDAISATSAFQPVTLVTSALAMSGKRIPPFQPLGVQTAALVMAGKRIPPFQPVSIQTPPLVMSGKRNTTGP